MTRGGNGWTAKVRGVLILVSGEMLSKVREIPFRGAIADSLGNRVDGFKYILEGEDVRGVFMVVTNQLSVKMWLLNHITTRILVPKIGRFDFITD